MVVDNTHSIHDGADRQKGYTQRAEDNDAVAGQGDEEDPNEEERRQESRAQEDSGKKTCTEETCSEVRDHEEPGHSAARAASVLPGHQKAHVAPRSKAQEGTQPPRHHRSHPPNAHRADHPPQKPSMLTRNTLLPDPSTLTPEQRAVVERHEKQLAWQKKELARQKRASDKRAEEIRTKGYHYKGRWVPLQQRPDFVVKVEAGEEGEEILVKAEADDRAGSGMVRSALANRPRATRADISQVTLSSLLATPHPSTTAGNRRRRVGGPDITKSFDKQYPLIAERVENEMLDEADDAGSLCEFVTADEWDDRENMYLDG
ncbi:hypothetical protein PSPO01_14741 [Paraphaeosphaeria sporulosa]